MPDSPGLPLDRSAELAGQWWLPDQAEHIASGRLTYEPSAGLKLELVSGSVILPDPAGSAPWVHGLTVDGRRITLRDCTVLDMRMSIPGGILVRAQVRQAFVGMHAGSERELRLSALRVRIANLPAWIDAPAIEADGRLPGSGQLTYGHAGPFGLARARGGVLVTADVEIAGAATPAQRPRSVSLEQRGWITPRDAAAAAVRRTVRDWRGRACLCLLRGRRGLVLS